jgi:hypothetical protein
MTISQRDLKLLWGRAANRCAMCRLELSQGGGLGATSYTLGEQAHIVGEKPGAARGISQLLQDERDGYHNLILLCPNHHTEIDKDVASWPIERLHKQKIEHEIWVNETLSQTSDSSRVAEGVAVAYLIDAAVQKCRLDSWFGWTSNAFSPDGHWSSDLVDEISEFRHQVIAAIWPTRFDELKRAAQALSFLLHRAAEKFLEHAKEQNNRYVTERFYRAIYPNPDYDRDVRLFELWEHECNDLIRDSTRAANWFADVVRKDVNPMFFIESGRFLVQEGPFMDFGYRTSLLEFTEQEKAEFPQKLLTKSR